MAKRGTLEHPKTLDLAGRLGIMEPFALGLLEAFWNWVGKYHPTGNVTNVRPALLAASIRYRGDAEQLWAVLQECNLVDRFQDGRLVVHDWSEHADEGVNAILARRQERFADGKIPSSGWLNKSERERFSAWAGAIRQKTGGYTADNLPATDATPTEPSTALPSTTLPEGNTLAPATPPPDLEDLPYALIPPKTLELVPPATRKKCSGVDPRFTPFKAAIVEYWARSNPTAEMPWDGSESKHLTDFLKACPRTDLAAFKRMLNHRGMSDVVQSHRPRMWLGALTDYANGPIDRYGKPMVQKSAPEASTGVQPFDAEDELLNLAASGIGTPDDAEQWAAEALSRNVHRWAASMESLKTKAAARLAAMRSLRERKTPEQMEADRAAAKYEEAVRFVFSSGRARVQEMQRALKIGYGQAVHALDRMIDEGLIGPPTPETNHERPLLKMPEWLQTQEVATCR